MWRESATCAMKFLMNGDQQGAVAEWIKSVQLFEAAGSSPNEGIAEVYYYLGKCQLDQNSLDDAIHNLSRAEQLFLVVNPQHRELKPAQLSLHKALSLAGRLPPPVAVASFKKGLKVLQKLGRLNQLKTKEVKAIFQENDWDYESMADEADIETLVQFLHCYYSEHEDLACADGFLTHDWRFGQETDDAPSEFAARLGDSEPLLKQVMIHENDSITFRRQSGDQFTIEIGSLDDIANLFNQELKNRADDRRFVPLETGSDFHIYLLLNKKEFKTLCQGKEIILPIDTSCGFEEFAWK